MLATPIPEKVFKLVPRLASDHEGEVVATVRALRRTLEGAGLSLYDLAAALQPQAPQAEPAAAGVSKRFGESVFDWPPVCQMDTLEDIAGHTSMLTPWERKFVSDVLRRLMAHKPMTRRQADVVDGIRDKLFGVN